MDPLQPVDGVELLVPVALLANENALNPAFRGVKTARNSRHAMLAGHHRRDEAHWEWTPKGRSPWNAPGTQVFGYAGRGPVRLAGRNRETEYGRVGDHFIESGRVPLGKDADTSFPDEDS